MLCPGCLRDVPDLVGPHEDLCPECFGIAADVVIPSLLNALDEGEAGDIFFEESAASGGPWSFLEEDEPMADPLFPESLFEENPERRESRRLPTFQGRPRF